VRTDQFTLEKAELACKTLGYRGAISWENSTDTQGDGTDGVLTVGTCEEGAQTLLNCSMKSLGESMTDDYVILLCQGEEISLMSIHDSGERFFFLI
jgi:hypothetical protein